MIRHLSGTILDKDEISLTVAVNGVGYCVRLPRRDLACFEKGAPVEFHIHTAVREDDISLYGFSTKEELRFFEQLISVNRIGPKSALEILETPMSQTVQAIVKKDLATLSNIPGIGRKTAERIVLELQDKMSPFLDGKISDLPMPHLNFSPDIMEALVRMGYQRKHIESVLKRMPENISDEKSIITYFLQNA